MAILAVLSTAMSEAERLARTHGQWMIWNTFLAVVPVVLAFVLFRPGRTRTRGWWFGLVTFVLFLPNAPYLLTDVVHLFGDIRTRPSDLQVLGIYVPVYLVLFSVGFVLYTTALDQLHRYVRVEAPTRAWWPIELTIHVLCAVGIYLGRVVRLNSWDVFTRPHVVLATTDRLPGLFAVSLVAVTTIVLIAGATLTRVFERGAVELVRSWRSAPGDPGAA
jgi:uncharacterized membrane protein